MIKIIDTPGIGDTRGLEADKKNLENMINFIGQYRELNAICIIMKPNQARVSVQFKYCIVEILKFLNKSAADNLLFIFTNCRSTNYELGDTGSALNKVLNEIRNTPPHVNIDLKNKDIKYFFDNESFRYLMKVANNIEVNERTKRLYRESWDMSVDECHRLFM